MTLQLTWWSYSEIMKYFSLLGLLNRSLIENYTISVELIELHTIKITAIHFPLLYAHLIYSYIPFRITLISCVCQLVAFW